jgi:predicted RNase H-like nuclease
MSRTVLGIDAAWTAHQPSGVALLQEQGQRWHCLAVAPSYASFLACAGGHPVDWEARHCGSRPDMAALLSASARLAGQPVDLIAIDMPLSTEPISGRRPADQQVSSQYGSQGCAVHSPTTARPGALANDLRAELEQLGYPLQTTTTHRLNSGGVLEVYPHVALLALLGLNYRFEYKVNRSTRYWPDQPIRQRIEQLLTNFQRLHTALQQQIGGIHLPLPPPAAVATLTALKP